MVTNDFWRFCLRWLPWCGIILPPLDGIINGILAAWEPNYNPLVKYVSDLGATDTHFGLALSAWWICLIPLFTPYAFALYAGIRGNRYGWISPILMAVFCITLGLCGVFRCSPNCASETPSTHAHEGVSDTATAALLLCPFFFWLAIRHDERWRGYRIFSLVMQVLGIAALIALGLASWHLVPMHGLLERTYWAVYYFWLFVVAIKLLRRGWSEERSSATVPDAAR